MTLSIKDAEELVRLAKIGNVKVLVGHVLLFHPAVIKIKEMIKVLVIYNMFIVIG